MQLSRYRKGAAMCDNDIQTVHVVNGAKLTADMLKFIAGQQENDGAYIRDDLNVFAQTIVLLTRIKFDVSEYDVGEIDKCAEALSILYKNYSVFIPPFK